MKNEQKKSLIINIAIGAFVVAVVVGGYFVFIKQDQASSSISNVTSVTNTASKTLLIGADIEATIRDLDNLKRAVESATMTFSSASFQNLQDFSVTIPVQAVGRTNPFLITSWKQAMIDLEKKSSTKTSTGITSQSATKVQTTTGGSVGI